MSEATATLLAYHGDEAIRQGYLARVRQHRLADELVQGYGYWEDGKGGGVGCTIHSGEHASYETEIGVPVRLAYLEDAIFEGLSPEEALTWPERFLAAIVPGADLSRVWNQFSHWLLTDSNLLTITDDNRAAIAIVAALHARAAAGEAVADSEWSAAESAAWSAAWAGRSAAAWAAWAARAAAAESAADYSRMAAKLLELLAAAPVNRRKGKA